MIDSRMNAQRYQEVLRLHLLPTAYNIAGRHWFFRQDNAAVHTANSTYEWFLTNGVPISEWPSKSPDFHPMENLWGILARQIYINGQQYEIINQLKDAIIKKWEEIPLNVLQNLIKSMPERINQVITKKGSFIGG